MICIIWELSAKMEVIKLLLCTMQSRLSPNRSLEKASCLFLMTDLGLLLFVTGVLRVVISLLHLELSVLVNDVGLTCSAHSYADAEEGGGGFYVYVAALRQSGEV